MINNAFYMIEKEAHIGPLDKVENYPCEGAREWTKSQQYKVTFFAGIYGDWAMFHLDI